MPWLSTTEQEELEVVVQVLVWVQVGALSAVPVSASCHSMVPGRN
jgi:hypothetical protein